MKPLRHWKIALTVAGIFVAGAVAGSVFTVVMMHRAFERSVRFEHWTEDVTAYLDRKLDLNPQQVSAIREIVEEMGAALRETVARTVRESWQIMAESGRRIDQELTPEQRAVHAEMSRGFRERLEKSFGLDLRAERVKAVGSERE